MERAKPTLNRYTPHSFYCLTTETDYGKVVGGSLPKMELNGPGWGAPPVSPNMPIFCEHAPLGFLIWVMVVLRGDTMIWFGFGLILPYVWALIYLVMGLTPLGLCRMVFMLVLLYIFSLYVYFHKFPPANGKSPKLVEFVSYQP
jgi:hypothetical protein